MELEAKRKEEEERERKLAEIERKKMEREREIEEKMRKREQEERESRAKDVVKQEPKDAWRRPVEDSGSWRKGTGQDTRSAGRDQPPSRGMSDHFYYLDLLNILSYFVRYLEKSLTNFYSDDISITCSAENFEELYNDLKTEGKNITMWMRQNKLRLNTNKTEYIIIGHKGRMNHI